MTAKSDMAMIIGREVFGCPKKITETFEARRKDNKVKGICIREGFSIMQIKANPTAKFDFFLLKIRSSIKKTLNKT